MKMEDQRLLQRILDGAEDPTDLPLQLLKDITNDFSKDRKIGQGGFGAVYKGVFGERIVAVKRIHINENTFDDRLFRREFVSLWNTNHRNVVRFLGFCSNTYQKQIQDAQTGEIRLASVLERLLCFEYISNGSLEKHITDELRGLEWETRYEIITGICKGLQYLHDEKRIIHMDLKPANILLHHQDEKYMVPKITDFGLSRPNKNSHTMGKRYGTRGYLAPEYENHGKTSFKSDIYSLGAIIIELVTGCKDCPEKNNVLRRWRHRWNKPPTHLQYHQVTRCINIAERCREQNPQARPSILDIISSLSESISTDGQISPRFNEDEMLRIKPLQLWLPSELKNEISRSVELTNDTLNCIAFNIQSPSLKYVVEPLKGTLQPKSKCGVKITVQAGDAQVPEHADKFIMQSIHVETSEGLRDEDITKHMFEKTSKFVDKVDLMVIYEPMEPQQNCKHRESTNMPEADQRKIVECAPGKRKFDSSENAETSSMDINSRARRKRNLHPPQSFSRHYRTNRKYLESESDRAVDHARGAMGSLLDKLGKLFMGDYSLDMSMVSDIDSLSLELTIMHRELTELENVDEAKVWVDEVRELSYHIEDMVDSFMVHVDPKSRRSGLKEIIHESVKLLENGMTTRHQIGDVIRDIKEKVRAVVNNGKNYNFNVKNVLANASTKGTIYPRMAAFRNEKQLIGIAAARDEIIRIFEKDGNVENQKLRIVSIVGMGGLGKTTLAKAVYAEHKGNHPKAFVRVGRNLDLKTILKKIICECQGREYSAAKLEHLDEWQLIKKLRDFLKNKRYFIVIDDLWDPTLWDNINSAFPRDNCSSRVITTTRIHAVIDRENWNVENKVYRMKPLSHGDSIRLLFSEIAGPGKHYSDLPRKEELSTYIITRSCGGIPLAIISIARLLAGQKDSTWEYICKSLDALTQGNDDVINVKKILDLSCIHLPDHLKTCLLYVCMYQEGEEIDKNDLLRKWVAEGFVHVSRNSVLDAEDVAEQYFEELINMSMIEPVKIDYNNEVLSCRVHDIILDLMRSKSSDVNFLEVIDGCSDVTGLCGKIRRVSVQHNDEDDMKIFETMKNKGVLSHVRSVLFYRATLVPYFLEFKYVRVLHLEDKLFDNKIDIDLTSISRLFLLRYLRVACSRLTLKLPNQIGQLQQLETIDLDGLGFQRYPSDIVSLSRLSHLRYGRYGGVVLPDGIDRMKSLRTLEDVCLYGSTVHNIKSLGELTNLRKLKICVENYWCLSKKEATKYEKAFHSSISRLSTCLRILTLGDIKRDDMLDATRWRWPLLGGGSLIQELNMHQCKFRRCPKWIGQLHHLYSLTIRVREVGNGVRVVAGLPLLAYFCLRIYLENEDEEKEESVAIPGSGGAFQALKHLRFYCKRASLTIEQGALPILEKLEIQLRYEMTHELLPVGIKNLPTPTLKQISLRVSKDDNDDSEDNLRSYIYREKLIEQTRKLRHLLKRAFKRHHPGADIIVCFEDDHIQQVHNEDAEGIREEEDYEEDDAGVDDEDDYYSTEDGFEGVGDEED